jgi:biotin carboxylase
MPRLLLLLPASTYRADAFLDAARSLRADVTVGTERTAVLPGPPSTDLLLLDLHDTDGAVREVLRYARRHAIDAVVGVDDRTAVLAAHLAGALGLPHNSVASVTAARNKYRMRQLLRDHGVPVPPARTVSLDDNPDILAGQVRFPCVLKPLTLSASCGVIRVDSGPGFVAAFHRIAALLHQLGLTQRRETGREILVEDFVPGREVALEGLLTAGDLRVLALFDKPDPMDGPFFEETIYLTPSRLPAAVQREIASCAARGAHALGLREGPIHGELRVNAQGVWVIEIAARSIGGRCSQTLRFAAGLSLEGVLLRQAFRMELPPLDRESGAAGVMMLPIPRAGVLREIKGQQAARAVPGIEDLTITAELGDTLVPLPEGTRYLGFLIARGTTPEQVESALREAHRRLEWGIDAEPGGHTAEDAGGPARGRRTIRF